MMGEVSLETSPRNILIQDMINSQNSINTTESTDTNIFKTVIIVSVHYSELNVSIKSVNNKKKKDTHDKYQ